MLFSLRDGVDDVTIKAEFSIYNPKRNRYFQRLLNITYKMMRTTSMQLVSNPNKGMKVSNTWKPVLSEKISNTCIPTKPIQMYVEHLQKYSPTNKAARLFQYNAVAAAIAAAASPSSSTLSKNKDVLMPSTSSLNSFYSRCPINDNAKVKNLPNAVSKLIHIDLKQLTCESGFDAAMFASTDEDNKTDLPHVAPEQRSKKCTCNVQQSVTSNQHKGQLLTPTSKHAAPVIVNNVVYTPTGEKGNNTTLPTRVKMFSPKIVLEKMTEKSPSYIQQNKIVSTQTVQLPSSIATLRITSHTNKKLSLADVKTETKGIIREAGKDQTKYQIKTGADLRKTKWNCMLNYKELPVLNLPHNNPASSQRNEAKSSDLCFNEQISKYHTLHELVKVLRRQKRSYPENAVLQQLHRKLKKEKCHFNMARVQKLQEELNASSTSNVNTRKDNVKDKKQSYCRLKTLCSKVQPYSVVDKTTNTNLCTLVDNATLATSFKRNNSEPAGRNELHSQQNKTSSLHTAVHSHSNNARRHTLRGHIKLSSTNGRIFSHIHLKQGNTARKGFIIDDLKINLIDLEKKIRKYTHKRITPLCEENKLEQNEVDRTSRNNTKIFQAQNKERKVSNLEESKTTKEEKGFNMKPEFRISRVRKDTSISLPDSMVFNKQASFSIKLPDKKNLKTLENSILVRSCFRRRHAKSGPTNGKDSLQQQKSKTKEQKTQSIIKPDFKYECNRKQVATQLKDTPWEMNNVQTNNFLSNEHTSKLTCGNSTKAATQGSSSSKVNKSQEENWEAISSRQIYSKDTLKAFTFRSQSFYSDYEHRKFRKF